MNSANIDLVLPFSFTRRNLSEIVRKMSTIKSNVIMIKDGRSAQMKSILGLVSLCCNQGDEVEIICMSKDGSAESDLKLVVQILKESEL